MDRGQPDAPGCGVWVRRAGGMMPEIYFFGCWQQVGHYLWRPDMERVGAHEVAEILGRNWKWIDGQCVPACTRRWDHGMHEEWTFLSSTDNTVDDRKGSHATFIARGEFTREQMQEMVWKTFPAVCARILFQAR